MDGLDIGSSSRISGGRAFCKVLLRPNGAALASDSDALELCEICDIWELMLSDRIAFRGENDARLSDEAVSLLFRYCKGGALCEPIFPSWPVKNLGTVLTCVTLDTCD